MRLAICRSSADKSSGPGRKTGIDHIHIERDGGGRRLVVVYRITPTAARKHARIVPAASVTSTHSVGAAAIKQPNSAMLYSGYGTAVVVALAAMAWTAFGRGRRRRATSEGGGT